ncbi:ABC transporter permease [Thermoleptolyngbya sichuanensis A183]|uniref:ABC transporter permease n=1 Tax=Thermoleptolyngbya sichuanensis A183 TaxID=2737172 RepID=A0A6M8BIH0_9CYAN|nr:MULTISPECIES: ABC transporter permease [Thermoleptolyngbya]MDG2617656.1 ABC transporter permease [Thermoleptolyngbya sichuanensis XZ-Cy5]QKD82245.1 ABC transporter permease [Thermoleptolyngbya sichuanensis A183]
MIRYVAMRLLGLGLTLLAISLVIFTILAVAPGDPMSEFASNPAITAEVRENIRRSLGLDQPLPVRYVKWLGALLRGDLGYSFTSRSPVSGLILQRLPTTLWIAGLSYLISVAIALPLGVFSALRRGSVADQVLTSAVLMGFSLPTFVTSLLMIIVFSVQRRWLPFIYDSTLVVRDWNSFLLQLKQSLMPVATLVLFQTAVLMRFVRAALLDELPQHYIRTAHAKGLSKRRIVLAHALRNALIPVVTLVALDLPSLFTGSLVVEQVFRVPGMGALLVESISRSDTPVVMAIAFIFSVLVVLLNLVADLLYGWLDPRVQG